MSKRYDFKAARDRQEEWRQYYRRMKKAEAMTPELEFEVMAQIEEIDREIAEAHQSMDAKMTTVTSSGHPVMHFENMITPIVPHWFPTDNMKHDPI